MARDATHVILRVNRIDRLHVLGPAGVAGEAARVDFLFRGLFEEEQLRSVRGIRDVAGSRAMAAFAPWCAAPSFLFSVVFQCGLFSHPL